jgi:very-short-patch-repair endonuclease
MQGSNRARQLRRNLTSAERRLWYRVRGRRFFSYKIRRQVPLGPYVADFVCMDARLIIEVDGGQHAERSAKDERRDTFLSERGFVTVRFWNNEVLGNFDGVLHRLKEVLDHRMELCGRHGGPHPSPLPGGRGDGIEKAGKGPGRLTLAYYVGFQALPAHLMRPFSRSEKDRMRVIWSREQRE